MNSWSSAATTLAATARDWRCASSANPGARTSETQIWTGRRPWARSRARCSRTLFRELVPGIVTSLLHVTIAVLRQLAERQSDVGAGRGSVGCRATASSIGSRVRYWRHSRLSTAALAGHGGVTDHPRRESIMEAQYL
jgi:hypothetical protein